MKGHLMPLILLRQRLLEFHREGQHLRIRAANQEAFSAGGLQEGTAVPGLEHDSPFPNEPNEPDRQAGLAPAPRQAGPTPKGGERWDRPPHVEDDDEDTYPRSLCLFIPTVTAPRHPRGQIHDIVKFHIMTLVVV
jgi:hypothetical protein